MQNPNKLLVLKPKFFGFNNETAANNYFQKNDSNKSKISEIAIEEHGRLTELLKKYNIDFSVLEDLEDIKNPDAVFLNNWFSIQPDKSMIIYPMWAKNRRTEVHPNQIEQIKKITKPDIVYDFTNEFENNRFCEGTGSLIFDHESKIIYASISERTTASLVSEISRKIGYDYFTFRATDQLGNAIYHTNVLLSIGKNIVVLCAEAVENPIERKMLEKSLKKNGKIFIEISLPQMNHFCANVLEVNDKDGNPVLLMSETAANNFSDNQKKEMSTLVRIAQCDIPTIERYGGGSLRCMIARG